MNVLAVRKRIFYAFGNFFEKIYRKLKKVLDFYVKGLYNTFKWCKVHQKSIKVW